MKNLMMLWTVAGTTCFGVLAQNGVAQSSSDAAVPPQQAGAPAAGNVAQEQLSYGVPEILNLSRSRVGDSTIIAYIGNSGAAYNLSAHEIIYLKEQGVSDAVLTAMLQHQQKPGKPASGTVPQTQVAATASAPQPAPTYAQAPPSAPPATVAASTTYVVPATTTAYYYPYSSYYYPYYSYPYYGGYYGNGYPGISLSFGFGNWWGWGGNHGYYHGGYHGDYHGGYHGGGHYAGGHGGHH